MISTETCYGMHAEREKLGVVALKIFNVYDLQGVWGRKLAVALTQDVTKCGQCRNNSNLDRDTRDYAALKWGRKGFWWWIHGGTHETHASISDTKTRTHWMHGQTAASARVDRKREGGGGKSPWSLGCHICQASPCRV